MLTLFVFTICLNNCSVMYMNLFGYDSLTQLPKDYIEKVINYVMYNVQI